MSLRGNTTTKTIVKGLVVCAKEFHWVFIIRVYGGPIYGYNLIHPMMGGMLFI
jgi:hypothetical protein